MKTDWFQELTKAEFNKQMNAIKDNEVLDKDSAQTPIDLMRRITETLGLGDYRMKLLDGCWFNPFWDIKLDSNFYTRKFPLRTIKYINPPFSQCVAFLIKCFMLFLSGMNVVIVMPREKYESCSFAKKYIDLVVEKVASDIIVFKGYGKTQTLNIQCDQYFLCQPDLKDFVEHKNKGTVGW